jgi:PAS domain-containing protein
MTTKSFWHKGYFLDNFTYLIESTPCERVIKSSQLVHYSDSIKDLFPDDHKMLEKFNAESYIGAPFHDANGDVIGSIAFLHTKPILMVDDVTLVLRTVKSRAESELYRLKREFELTNREHQLRGLINGVKDLLINLNQKGQIEMLNATAEAWLGISVAAQEKRRRSHPSSRNLAGLSF